MSILDKDKIDLIGTNTADNTVCLTISDHLDWEDQEMHLLALQDKINGYLTFIEDGQIYTDYPDAQDKKIVIQIANLYTIPSIGIEFLSKAATVTHELDIDLVFKETPFLDEKTK